VFGEDTSWLPLTKLRTIVEVEQGESVEQVAARLGKGKATVKKWLSDFRKSGLPSIFPNDERQSDERIKQFFANLYLARLAEDLFEEIFADSLADLGMTCEDRRQDYTETDFAIVDRGEEICHVNVKAHSSKFQNALSFVGLQPEDTFPLAVYKILLGYKTSKQIQIPHIFAVSILWGVVDEALSLIEPNDVGLIDLVFRTRVAQGKRKAEDRVVDYVVSRLKAEGKWVTLVGLLKKKGMHRVISAKKAQSLFLELFDKRCIGLSLAGFGSRFKGKKGVPAEVNMHFSISQEMKPLEEFLQTLKRGHAEGIKQAIEQEQL